MLLVVCCSVFAEWRILAKTDGEIFYVDFDTIRSEGNIRRFWALKDFSVAKENGMLSSRAFEEFDCKEGRFRILDISAHSEHGAAGKTIQSFSNIDGEWTRIAPETVRYFVLKVVCKK